MVKKVVKVEVRRRSGVGFPHQYYFRLVSRNGRILAHSETFTRKFDAKKAAARLRGVVLNVVVK